MSMPYTLMKGLAWFSIALALGITVGWLLRSVTASRQITRLRARVAELESTTSAIPRPDEP
jgi:hypothetical protein